MSHPKGSWANRRIGQCQICKRWVRRNTLKMMAHDRLIPGPGANQLLYSRYEPDYWTCTCTSAGLDSVGVEDARVKYEPYVYGSVIQDPNTLEGSTAGESHSIVNGAPAWIGPGTLRTAGTINIGGWSRVMFAIHVGYHQRDSHSLATVELGLCDPAGANRQTIQLYEVYGSRFVWFSISASSVNSVLGENLCPYVTFTPNNAGCWWWSDDAQMEEALRPGIYYQTAGASVVLTADKWVRTMARTCPQCREKLFDLGKMRGKPRQEPDLPVPTEKLEEG